MQRDAMLKQLGYSPNEALLSQMGRIIENTKDFNKFSQHLPSFNDALAIEKGFIAMSNSENHLKIKCDEDTNADNLSAYTELVHHWADKYKLELKKVNNFNFLFGLPLK